MQKRGEERDYVPLRERNVNERMAEGASLEDGLSGSMKATHRQPPYRHKYRDGERVDPRGQMARDFPSILEY